MSFNSYDDNYEDEDSFDDTGSINPNDSYSSRFKVKSRKSSFRPRSAITTSDAFRRSEKIFSRRHSNKDLGGSVNVKNINRSKEKRLVTDMPDNRIAHDNFIQDNQEINSPANSIETLPEINIEKDNVNYVKDSASVNTSNNSVNSNAEQDQISSFRSAGLDSLFSSTVQKDDETKVDSSDKTQKIDIQHDTPKVLQSNESQISQNIDFGSGQIEDQKESVEEPRPRYKPQGENRKLKVLKPIGFGCVKEISSALKSGYALVICLKRTNPNVSGRILDFAFGAASICGAQVSLEAEKTYVFTIGPGLTQREKLLCIKEGVPLQNEDSKV